MRPVTCGAVVRPIYELFEQGTLAGMTDEQLVERFVAGRDETAFEALVTRHGRSVLAVCRDVLRDGHDAEDAFQATFLILARKAGSLWVRGSLAAWLHRVARRVSIEANSRNARRRRFEKTGLEVDTAERTGSDPLLGLMEVLHEEIDRLPEKYRAPIVLCELEALTRDQAAHRLGWQPGTVAGRLARARSILRDRIGRRGDVDAARLAQATAARRATALHVPWALIEKTASLATSTAKSRLASLGGSELARRATSAIILAKLKFSAVTSIAAVLASTAVFVSIGTALPETKLDVQATVPAERIQTPPKGGSADAARTTVPLAGAVVLQDGTPARGARVFFSSRDHGYDEGEVRAETVTRDGGEFDLDVPKVDAPWAGSVGSGALWAYRPGSVVASMPVYRGALPLGLPEQFVLAPGSRAVFEVVGPDGNPVSGAMIEPLAFDRDTAATIPRRLASIIGADTITNARGRAVMTAFFADELIGIRVTAKGHGRQEFSFNPGTLSAGAKVVKLHLVGGLKGKIVGDPGAVRHRALRVSSFSPPGDQPKRSYLHVITTDDSGHFDIPQIAVGPHGVSTVPRYDFAWFAGPDGLVNIEPGKTTEVVLTVKPAVRVRGVVREKGTEKPIAGVRVAVTLAETGAMTSDKDGIYEGYAPPGAAFITARSIPPEYARPLYGPRPFVVPENVANFDLPPFDLMPAGEITGLVVDDHARKTAGARVEATWTLDETRPGTGPHHLSCRTGPDGRFVFQGVPLDAEVSLWANHRASRTIEPTAARVGEAKILHLAPSQCVAMGGRVLDSAGRPLPGANVHLRARPSSHLPSIEPFGPERLVAFEQGFVFVTDREGRFHTPMELEPDRQYVAYASAEGYQTNRTGLTLAQTGTFADLTLRAHTVSP
jgi:RNA polymerase sigma factor (sigma-70 family)